MKAYSLKPGSISPQHKSLGGLANGESAILNWFLIDLRARISIRKRENQHKQLMTIVHSHMNTNARLRALERLEREVERA